LGDNSSPEAEGRENAYQYNLTLEVKDEIGLLS